MTKDEQTLAEGLALIASPRRELSDEELECIAEAGGVLVHALRAVRKLEARVAELEARPELKHVGVWRKGTQYREQHCVSHGGSLWKCCAPTSTAKPGKSPNWKLIVKRGQVQHDDLATQAQAL